VYAAAFNELDTLQKQQKQLIIDNDPAYAEIYPLIQAATRTAKAAKRHLEAHLLSHHCE
jgi:hypothetical protein